MKLFILQNNIIFFKLLSKHFHLLHSLHFLLLFN
nr:MAG TPA: hypothetical protein [Bacteriophage sp.]